MTMYDNALVHSGFASHSCSVNASLQTPLQTDKLSLLVHVWASNLFIQPVERAKLVAPVRFCYMKINHGGFNAPMAQEFLDRYDIHTKLQ